MTLPVDPGGIAALAGAFVYLVLDHRVRRIRGRGVSRGRRWAFLAGIIVIVVALTGPIDAAVTRSFSAHMVQHLLLTMVAAPLLLIGAPVTLALMAWPGKTRRRLLGALHSGPARLPANPLVTWTLFFAVIWGSHLTGLYDAALRNEGVHAVEHLVYLSAALLFWLPIVGADPIPTVLSYPARILYLFLAMPAMAFLGLALTSANHVLYPAYAHAEGVAALADQQTAGAIMWGGTMIFVVPALAIVLLGWMSADDREAARIDARLARTETSDASATTSEPARVRAHTSGATP